MSNQKRGRVELIQYLPTLLLLFKRLLLEFDNSEMNILVTNILNNIVSKNDAKDKELDQPKTLIIADTGTEVLSFEKKVIGHTELSYDFMFCL